MGISSFEKVMVFVESEAQLLEAACPDPVPCPMLINKHQPSIAGSNLKIILFPVRQSWPCASPHALALNII